MKYNVGDKVRIKSIDWYNENTDNYGAIYAGNGFVFWKNMVRHCGEIMKITIVKVDPEDSNKGYYFMENSEDKWTDEMIEGLVERNGKTYPYKIGDRVILKGENRCATITDLKYNSHGNLSYFIKIDNDKDISIDYPTDLLLPYDNKIEGLVEEENTLKAQSDNMEIETHRGYYTTEPETTSEGKKRCVVYFWDNNFADKVELDLSGGRELIQEDGKWFVVKKKKEYPKTYEECKYILGITTPMVRPDYNGDLIVALQKLLICRNAYWKLAGEEMGLDKHWEPDWREKRYIIYRNQDAIIGGYREAGYAEHHIFEFPTKEMRDAFKENFDSDIKICKEFL